MGLCDLLPPTSPGCLIGGVASAATDAAASSVFDAAASKIMEGFATSAQMVVTFWTGVDVPGLNASAGPIAELRGNTAWLTAFVAALSVLVCAGRLAVTRSSRPAGEAFKGLLILVLVSGCGVGAVNALTVFGDSYSRWVLDRSTDGQLGARMARLALVGDISSLGFGLMLIIGLLGMFSSLAQLGLMLVRVGVVTIFAGLMPLAAAGTGTQTGMDYFKRMLSWLLAFVLYKPAAATVYAAAFLLVGDGSDATSVLSGLFMMILSIVALPAMLRLVTPMVGSAVAAGAGAGGGVAAAGMVLASGARMSGGGGGGGARPAPPTGGGQAAGLIGGGGPTGSGGGAGGGGGGGRPAPARGGGSAAAGGGMAAAGGGMAAAAQAGMRAAQVGAQAASGAVRSSSAGLDGAPAGAGR